MKATFATILFVATIVAGALAIGTRQAEVIVLVAQRELQLFDPSTLAGHIGDRPTTIAVVPTGERLQVVDCRDRKSDIDVVVEYQGKRAVPEWSSGAYKLIRKPANLLEIGATSACVGLL